MAKFLSQWIKWCARPGRLRVVLLGCAVLLSTACANQSYMGISLVPGQASPEVQELARRALNGDKQPQLDLGIRFEDGEGVPQNISRALKLYRQAAADSGDKNMMYIPSAGGVRAIPVSFGRKSFGLPEAQQRANNLRSLQINRYNTVRMAIYKTRIHHIDIIENEKLCDCVPTSKCKAYVLHISDKKENINGFSFIAVDRYDDNGGRVSEWSKEAVFFENSSPVNLIFHFSSKYGVYLLDKAEIDR